MRLGSFTLGLLSAQDNMVREIRRGFFSVSELAPLLLGLWELTDNVVSWTLRGVTLFVDELCEDCGVTATRGDGFSGVLFFSALVGTDSGTAGWEGSSHCKQGGEKGKETQ